ncbi:pyridoxal phosphate-dependent transferase [Thelonectria olida]|uniref:Pyridoxal phosphate-dependent transferase n=1 Tax=Thelonectria olida TaxID=1576542 RepID=A0A9P8W4X3_9HYPO|nr:pyridoxal phosphate-dependent transferase [Thelonectria olida]
MGSVPENTLAQATAANHKLSTRGACGLLYRDVWGPREKSMGNPWSPANPSGTIILRLAENSLMHDDIKAFMQEQINVHPTKHLTYSTGPRGSHRLRRAAAEYLNDGFQPRKTVTMDNIFITPGVASAIDALAWAICNEGEGILIPLPLYNGFVVDIANRSNVRVIGIRYEGIEGYSDLEDLFHPGVNRRAIEAALRQAKADGTTIRALLISHPHNPLGRCYPPETLREFAALCGENDLHFVSDEIYAKSVFVNTAVPEAASFVSTLSLDLCDVLDPKFHHVLYGASKDFCANGFRLGLVCTRNEGIMGALSSISIFSWSPHVLQDIWAAMLENKQWLNNFLRKKTQLMQENYVIATSFLRKHGIPFSEVTAGLFIWVDLRYLLWPHPVSQQADYSVLKATSSDASIYEHHETRIANICIKNGVMIAPGHVYLAEEYGWFRLTFTVGKEALQEGLDRLWRSIQEVERENSRSK